MVLSGCRTYGQSGNTGDSSTPLRMTCDLITIGLMHPPLLGLDCHGGEAARQTKRPRKWAGEGFRCTSTREDGRFFAPLRMTCFTIAICEMFRSYVCQYCHPEEAALPARESPAGWPTKDLLQHGLIPELMALSPTWQAARLRLHSQGEAARVLMRPPKLSCLESRCEVGADIPVCPRHWRTVGMDTD